MPLGRPLVPLTLTDEQQDQLNGIARSATLPHALVQRAGMILASAEGSTNSAVALRFGVTPQTVGKWRVVSQFVFRYPFPGAILMTRSFLEVLNVPVIRPILIRPLLASTWAVPFFQPCFPSTRTQSPVRIPCT